MRSKSCASFVPPVAQVNVNFRRFPFSYKVQSLEVTIPPATVVELPPVSVQGELISRLPRPVSARSAPRNSGEGHRRPPSSKTHLYVSAEIGAFQHSLTTDLLNHLVFVQKSFMKVKLLGLKQWYTLLFLCISSNSGTLGRVFLLLSKY